MNIIFERGEFFIREIGKDFIVFRNGVTAATKVPALFLLPSAGLAKPAEPGKENEEVLPELNHVPFLISASSLGAGGLLG